jgi:UDP-N-acetylmuramate--alanine ligase
MNVYLNKIMENFLDKKPAIHFIGIGGIGMSALAGTCIEYGYTVSGSDIADNENIRLLISKGAQINLYHSKDNIKNCDIVVFTSAIKPDNPELMQAVKLNKCVLERHKFLGVIFNSFEKNIAVSGSHGKTTACGFITQILMEADSDPQVLIGGNLKLIGGNYRKGKGCCIAEACEYKRHFLSLKPFVPIVLNVENDHMDYYKNSLDVIAAYDSFLGNKKEGGTGIINGDDSICRSLKNSAGYITYGFNENNACRAVNVKKYRGKYSFTLCYKDKELPVKLNVCGRHNIYNALAAYCAAKVLNIDDCLAIKAIGNFTGVSRRFEFVGKTGDVPVICDYAHHPSEIEAVLRCAREVFRGTITAVFQPHTYSRTKAFMESFSKCFDAADRLVLLPVYAAREDYDGEGSSAALYEKIKSRGKSVIYLDSFKQAEMYLRSNKSDCIMILGAGDIIKLAGMLVDTVNKGY